MKWMKNDDNDGKANENNKLIPVTNDLFTIESWTR